jgi:hypothetical protein
LNAAASSRMSSISAALSSCRPSRSFRLQSLLKVAGRIQILSAAAEDAGAMLGMKDGGPMRLQAIAKSESGKAGWAILWLLGVPIPILAILFLVRGCT